MRHADEASDSDLHQHLQLGGQDETRDAQIQDLAD
jgi:hypothetical protein